MTSLRIVGGGEPTDEELAALVTVVSLIQSRGDDDDSNATAGRWRRAARPAAVHQHDGWRAYARHSALRHGL